MIFLSIFFNMFCFVFFFLPVMFRSYGQRPCCNDYINLSKPEEFKNFMRLFNLFKVVRSFFLGAFLNISFIFGHFFISKNLESHSVRIFAIRITCHVCPSSLFFKVISFELLSRSHNSKITTNFSILPAFNSPSNIPKGLHIKGRCFQLFSSFNSLFHRSLKDIFDLL